MRTFLSTFLISLVTTTILLPGAVAQSARGTITGRVADDWGGVLLSAQIALEPQTGSAFADQQGEFTISNVAAGQYKITVTYRGFARSRRP